MVGGGGGVSVTGDGVGWGRGWGVSQEGDEVRHLRQTIKEIIK